jgi:hypothetical protein
MAQGHLTDPLPWLRPLLMAVWMLGLITWPIPGCREEPVPAGHERVVIDGRTFDLELAVDEETRTKGLGGREFIPEDGGMLFVFPRPTRKQFIMRDCPVDIDIIFLDANARITAMHHMEAEPPRGPGEGVVGDWDPRKAANRRYEARLKRYSSRGAAQFAVELQGGMLEALDLELGEKLDLDTDRLKEMAR